MSRKPTRPLKLFLEETISRKTDIKAPSSKNEEERKAEMKELRRIKLYLFVIVYAKSAQRGELQLKW